MDSNNIFDDANDPILKRIPVLSADTRIEIDQDGSVIVFKKEDHRFQRFARKTFFKSLPTESNMRLDEYGSFIVKNIDGKKDLYTLGQLLEAQYQEASHPLYERLLEFVNYIEIKRNWITYLENN